MLARAIDRRYPTGIKRAGPGDKEGEGREKVVREVGEEGTRDSKGKDRQTTESKGRGGIHGDRREVIGQVIAAIMDESVELLMGGDWREDQESISTDFRAREWKNRRRRIGRHCQSVRRMKGGRDQETKRPRDEKMEGGTEDEMKDWKLEVPEAEVVEPINAKQSRVRGMRLVR